MPTYRTHDALFRWGPDTSDPVEIRDGEGRAARVALDDVLAFANEVELQWLPARADSPGPESPITDVNAEGRDDLDFRDADDGGFERMPDTDESTGFGVPDRASADDQDLATALAWLEDMARSHGAAEAALRVIRRASGDNALG